MSDKWITGNKDYTKSTIYFLDRYLKMLLIRFKLTSINMLVVFRICCLNVTTNRTRPFPKVPNNMISARTTGTIIDIIFKKFIR